MFRESHGGVTGWVSNTPCITVLFTLRVANTRGRNLLLAGGVFLCADGHTETLPAGSPLVLLIQCCRVATVFCRKLLFCG